MAKKIKRGSKRAWRDKTHKNKVRKPATLDENIALAARDGWTPYEAAIASDPARNHPFLRMPRVDDEYALTKVSARETAGLLAELLVMGLVLDRARFDEEAGSLWSAWALGEQWCEQLSRQPIERPEKWKHLVRAAACELWKRWSPDRPSNEMLVDAMASAIDDFYAAPGAPFLNTMNRLQDRLGPAVRNFEQAATTFPAVILLREWLNIGSLAAADTFDPKRAKDGVAFLDAALEQFPDLGEVSYVWRLDRIDALRRAGALADAKTAAESFMEDYPDKAAGYAAFADLLEEEGDTGAAVSVLQQAVDAAHPSDCVDYGIFDRLHFLEGDEVVEGTIDWVKATRNVPTHDLLAEHAEMQKNVHSFDDNAGQQELVEDFIYLMASGYYHTWEAVIRQEQGLKLSNAQARRIGGLVTVSDRHDEPTLYIDEYERPDRPWYEILRVIAANLVTPPSELVKIETEPWDSIVDAVLEFGAGLSLPDGVEEPMDVVPEDIRQRLDIQSCFQPLVGAGRWGNPPLNDDGSAWRVDAFVMRLSESIDLVRERGLTPARFSEFIELPERDQRFLVNAVVDRLAMPGPDAPLVDYLEDFESDEAW